MNSWLRTISGLLIISTQSFAATVYKSVDKDGNTVFSDTPMKNAETVDIKPVTTIKMDKATPNPTREQKKKTAPFKYKSIAIVSPTPDEHFINNLGMVTVSVQLEPALKNNHKIELLLNGKKRAGPRASNSFSLSNLDRGSYRVVAQVIDDKGKALINSPAISFHVRRATAR